MSIPIMNHYRGSYYILFTITIITDVPMQLIKIFNVLILANHKLC